MSAGVRRLVLVLGDQLWLGNPALDGFDASQDRVLMIEAEGEATAVWSHPARIALFLAAMRHFRDELLARGFPLDYLPLDDAGPPDLTACLAQALAGRRPAELHVCEAGDWRVEQSVREQAQAAGVRLVLHPDSHFLCSRQEFARWAGDKRELRMEFFYREMRRRHGVLMEGREPVGGRWNFDADNRQGFGKKGPGWITEPARFEPDVITREVLALVRQRFADHPGSLESFAWPVTRAQALEALDQFVRERLADFGPWQDAMWTRTPWAWHSLLSAALNLHLIHPREVIDAALTAWRERNLPLASVEGFVRQILGWREFVRGLYWLDMPRMAQANHHRHERPLPTWYWTGRTRMACMRDVIGQTLEHGYAHHIQRLMVTGQFALLAGIAPSAVCDWYLAMYVDAVEWVELPNTAGMALHALGGRMTSKPYVASGQYVKRMSNYCDGCAYRPERRTGEGACPMTTLYWHFLDREEAVLSANPRTALMAQSVRRLPDDERASIRRQAAYILEHLDDL